MRAQGLLKRLDECEYPAEFLAALLLGKKGALFRNWEFLITGSDAVAGLQNTVFYPLLKEYGAPGIWRFLRHEHLWVYKRMNNKLRHNFASYFLLHEINTLVLCLRYLSRKVERDRVEPALQNSLLHRDIQDILTSSLDFSALLQKLEFRLCAHDALCRGLREIYEIKGITALEVFMRDCFFAFLLSRKQPFLLQKFLQYQVDFHNCISLAKRLRWQIETDLAMVPGGTVPLDRFKKAYFRKDLAPVLQFLHLQDTDGSVSAIQRLETALLCFISKKLRGWSRQRTVAGDILYYLWEQYRYTRNISMVLHTTLLDDEPVRESIVA